MFALFLVRTKAFPNQCQLCQFAAKVSIEAIDKKLTDPQIKTFLTTKCADIAPAPIKPFCDQIVDIPLNSLIKLVRDEQTPTKACCLVKMCKKVSRNNKVRPVSNGGPQFQDETNPTWSVSWEEQI